MTNNSKILLLGGVSAAVFFGINYLTKQAAAIRNIQLTFGLPTNFKFNYKAFTISAKQPVTLLNASSQSIKFDGLDLTLYSKGVAIGKAYILDRQTIGVGKTNLLFDVDINIQSLVSVVSTANLSKPLILDWEGQTTYLGNTIPIKEQQTFQLPAWLLVGISQIKK